MCHSSFAAVFIGIVVVAVTVNDGKTLFPPALKLSFPSCIKTLSPPALINVPGLRKRCRPADQQAKLDKDAKHQALQEVQTDKRRRKAEAAAPPPPPAPISSGIGHKLLQMMGWKSGEGLGKEGQGKVEPVAATISGQTNADKRGIGQVHVTRTTRATARKQRQKEKARSKKVPSTHSSPASAAAAATTWLLTGGQKVDVSKKSRNSSSSSSSGNGSVSAISGSGSGSGSGSKMKGSNAINSAALVPRVVQGQRKRAREDAKKAQAAAVVALIPRAVGKRHMAATAAAKRMRHKRQADNSSSSSHDSARESTIDADPYQVATVDSGKGDGCEDADADTAAVAKRKRWLALDGSTGGADPTAIPRAAAAAEPATQEATTKEPKKAGKEKKKKKEPEGKKKKKKQQKKKKNKEKSQKLSRE